MIERIVTVAIMASSFLLFCYWFRYACHLILSAATSRDYATDVARTHQLCFQEAQRQMSHGATELDRLKGMLDRDYAVLDRLMNHTEDAQAGIELRMLAIHFRLTAVWYRSIRGISSSAACAALYEMSQVVAYFANSIGEAAASPAAA